MIEDYFIEYSFSEKIRYIRNNFSIYNAVIWSQVFTFFNDHPLFYVVLKIKLEDNNSCWTT